MSRPKHVEGGLRALLTYDHSDEEIGQAGLAFLEAREVALQHGFDGCGMCFVLAGLRERGVQGAPLALDILGGFWYHFSLDTYWFRGGHDGYQLRIDTLEWLAELCEKPDEPFEVPDFVYDNWRVPEFS